MTGHYDHQIEKRDAILSTARISPAARARIMGEKPNLPPAKMHRITVDIPSGKRTVERLVETPKAPPVAKAARTPKAPKAALASGHPPIADLPPAPNRPVPSQAVTPLQVLEAVATAYGVTVEDLLGPSPKQAITQPRFAAAHLLKAKRIMSTTQIGHVLGRRDHTTVVWALRRAYSLMGRDIDWTARYCAAAKMLEDGRTEQ